MGKENELLTVVGVGASAGGLEALQQFFEHMPDDTGLAFVVIQHLSPDYKSMMDELLARHTRMPIKVIDDGEKIEVNHIYLIPPRQNLRIFKNQLFLTNQDTRKGLHLPIDIFFKSLADEKGKNAIAVILSGTGSDGTMGSRAVKEVNGLVMVQDERTAKFYGMPSSAISTGMVDFILPPSEMGTELLSYLKHPLVKKSNTSKATSLKGLDSLSKVTMIIRDYTGIDFSFYKENTVTRRLERRVSINRFNDLDEYVQFLINSDKEKEILYTEFLIGVTQFFRDKEAFESLLEKVITPMVKSDKNQIRVWSTGCSTGEEAYSLAIMFREAAEKNAYRGEIKIFATDLDRRAVEIAGKGIYSESVVANVDTYLLKKYFYKTEGGFRINEDVRNMIVFATHNLLKDPPFSKLDLLVCRNLFIYLKPDIQLNLLARFYHSLNATGYLFMGSSETLSTMSDAFSVLDLKNKIYQYKPGFTVPLIDGLSLDLKKNKALGNYARDLPKKNKELKSNELLGNVMDQFIPPSIIVDSNFFVVSVINNINPFTEIQAGNYSNELFSILPRDLGLFVNNLVRVLKNSAETYANRVVSGLNSLDDKTVNIEARKLFHNETKYFMLSFSLVDKKAPLFTNGKEIDDFDYSSEQGTRVSELENELTTVKESLAATVEELESANEELQSSNEELIASNEELQSTNEELQSVNEELYTVNSEHQQKIEELTRLNSDINNLLKNTDVAAIYLDAKLCIRKITPQVSNVTNILETDIGRPITHLTLMDAYPDFENDVNAVMENLQPIDKEMTDKHGLPLFVRMRPYRTSNNAVDGVMVTLIDVSALFEREKLLRLVLEESPVTTVMLNPDGWIIYANKKAEELFNITKEEILKRNYDASAWEISDISGKPIDSSQLPFAIIKETGKPLYGFKHYIKVPKRKKVLINIDGAPVFTANKQFKGVVFTMKIEGE